MNRLPYNGVPQAYNGRITENTDTKIKVYSGKFRYRLLSENVRYFPPPQHLNVSTITKIYDKTWRSIPPKVVAFDLDETIGHFTDLYLIWKTIFTKGIYRGKIARIATQKIFNDLLDLYPEFLRYGILHILAFIKQKIQTGESHCIYLYTNNRCDFSVWSEIECSNPTEWVEMIIVYLNIKLDVNETIFAKPICAFKINNRIIEPLRESTNKTHRDFLKCSILPKTTEICFIDNTYYAKMCHDKVYYIQPPSYIHSLAQNDIIERFVSSKLHRRLVNEFQYSLTAFSSVEFTNPKPPFNKPQYEIYTKLLYYIKEFFCMTIISSPTRKRSFRIGKFTRKKRRKHA